jgi:hypothetical protein
MVVAILFHPKKKLFYVLKSHDIKDHIVLAL